MSRIWLFMAAAERPATRRAAQLGMAGLGLVIFGCAHLASTASFQIPPVPTGQARIWFYRDYEPYAGRGRPAIAANGAYVGIAELGGAFYRDVPPGHYRVTVETTGVDVNQTSDLELGSGREAFIKIVSNPSWVSGTLSNYERPTFYAWLIPSEAARGEVAKLAFFGGN